MKWTFLEANSSSLNTMHCVGTNFLLTTRNRQKEVSDIYTAKKKLKDFVNGNRLLTVNVFLCLSLRQKSDNLRRLWHGKVVARPTSVTDG